MSHVPAFLLLTTPYASGDNFGTLIRISHVVSLHSRISPKVCKFKKVKTFDFSGSSII
jgi:hypothetical protein